jgi:hypothetical protein
MRKGELQYMVEYIGQDGEYYKQRGFVDWEPAEEWADDRDMSYSSWPENPGEYRITTY